MGQNEKLFNYMLSAAFILLIVIFLALMIQISRYVLRDDTILQEHVINTRDMLENIESIDKNSEIKHTINQELSKKTLNIEKHIKEISYLNVNKDKSILTLILNSKINNIDCTYYLEINNFHELNTNNIVLYTNKENINKGVIFVIENENTIKLYNLETSEIEVTSFENIIGKVIYDEKEINKTSNR